MRPKSFGPRQWSVAIALAGMTLGVCVGLVGEGDTTVVFGRGLDHHRAHHRGAGLDVAHGLALPARRCAGNPCAELRAPRRSYRVGQEQRRAEPAGRRSEDRLLLRLPDRERSEDAGREPARRSRRACDCRYAGVALLARVSACFAPMYRQATLAAINGATRPAREREEININDAVQRRGRSVERLPRGTTTMAAASCSSVTRKARECSIKLLRRATSTRIQAVRRLLVSAVLLGGNVTVKQGAMSAVISRTFLRARSFTQTGCVVAVLELPDAASRELAVRAGRHRPARRQPQGTRLPGRLREPGRTIGRRARRRPRPYFATTKFPGLIGTVSGPPPKAPTPWVAYPDRYTVQCRDVRRCDVVAGDARARRSEVHRLGDARSDVGTASLRLQHHARRPPAPRRTGGGGVQVVVIK